MQEGHLVAQGSPDELALTCPEFQRLTSLQNQPRDASATGNSKSSKPTLLDLNRDACAIA